MADLIGLRAIVVGAGVAGLCTALELASRGARTCLIDEGAATPNASAVAAGMIAPAFEAALEEPGRGRLPLLRAARDLWPEVADGLVQLHRDGALAVSDRPADLKGLAQALQAEGADFQVVSAPGARALCPLLTADLAGGVFSPEDWRIDAGVALEILASAFAGCGGERRRERLEAPGLRRLTATADAVIVCAGWGARRFAPAAPELAVLSPIKGQLVRFPGAAPLSGPTLRGAAGYLAPGQGGVAAGASMEAGRSDTALSAQVHARLAAAAVKVLPHLEGRRAEGLAGVRAATPDGLPLVGASGSGLHLVTGFRRNGWLLAPLAARITADRLAGRDPGPWADALRPDRFG